MFKHTPEDVDCRNCIEFTRKGCASAHCPYVAERKGEAYRRWAMVENLKRMAKTYLYMEEYNLSYEQLTSCFADVSEQVDALSEKVEQCY